jgi:hypothetical protein
MKTIRAISIATLLIAGLVHALEAKPPDNSSWTGNYTDKKFLNGQAVFQLNIVQEGAQVTVDFDGAYNDGHGCAPEANASAKVIDKNTLKFTFTDSANNAGAGTITRAGEDVIISVKPTRVADPRCAVFYPEKLRLRPAR